MASYPDEYDLTEADLEGMAPVASDNETSELSLSEADLEGMAPLVESDLEGMVPFDELSPVSEDTLGEALTKVVETTPERFQRAGGGLLAMAGDPTLTAQAQVDPLLEAAKEGDIGFRDYFKTATNLVFNLPAILMRGEIKDDSLMADANRWMSDTGREIAAAAEEEIALNRVDTSDPVVQFAADVATGTIDMIPALTAGFLTRSPSASNFQGALKGASFMAPQVAGHTYIDRIDKGVSESEAMDAVKFNVLSEVLPETIPMMALMKKGSPFLKRVVDSTLGEGAQELLTSVMQQTYDNQTLEEMSLIDAIKSIDWKQARYDGLVGIGVGGTLSVPAHIADLASNRNDAPDDALSSIKGKVVNDISESSEVLGLPAPTIVVTPEGVAATEASMQAAEEIGLRGEGFTMADQLGEPGIAPEGTIDFEAPDMEGIGEPTRGTRAGGQFQDWQGGIPFEDDLSVEDKGTLAGLRENMAIVTEKGDVAGQKKSQSEIDVFLKDKFTELQLQDPDKYRPIRGKDRSVKYTPKDLAMDLSKEPAVFPEEALPATELPSIANEEYNVPAIQKTIKKLKSEKLESDKGAPKNVLHDIASRGQIDWDMAVAEGFDPADMIAANKKGMPFGKPLFKKGSGNGFDSVAEKFSELGVSGFGVGETYQDTAYSADDAINLVGEMISGKREPVYMPGSETAELERQQKGEALDNTLSVYEGLLEEVGQYEAILENEGQEAADEFYYQQRAMEGYEQEVGGEFWVEGDEATVDASDAQIARAMHNIIKGDKDGQAVEAEKYQEEPGQKQGDIEAVPVEEGREQQEVGKKVAFAQPHEYKTEQYEVKAAEHKLSETQKEAFKPEDERDDVTGMYPSKDRVPTMNRARDYVDANKTEGSYGDIDVRNLGGLNAAFTHTGANKHFKAFADIIAKHADDQASVKFRHGGDEMSVVAPNTPVDRLIKQLSAAQDEINQYVKDNDLQDLPHAKHEGKSDAVKEMAKGTGIYFGVSMLDTDVTNSEIIQAAEEQTEAQKPKELMALETEEETDGYEQEIEAVGAERDEPGTGAERAEQPDQKDKGPRAGEKAEAEEDLDSTADLPDNSILGKLSANSLMAGVDLSSDSSKAEATVKQLNDLLNINLSSPVRLPFRGRVSPFSKGFTYARLADIKIIADLFKKEAFVKEGYSSLDVPAQSAVLDSVVGMIRDNKIFRSVVSSVPVDVMNDLAGEKLSADDLFNDGSMFIDALSIDSDLAVRGSAIDAIIGSLASPIAKDSAEDLAIIPVENGSTTKTSDIRHSDSVEQAEKNTATHPDNESLPTEGQIKAGNYRLGHVKINGLDISIENPKGSIRSGTDDNDTSWSVEMQHPYGYIKGTVGADSEIGAKPHEIEQVDVFIGDNTESEKVFIIDQINPKNGEFDEHKVVIGANSADEASEIYNANYSKSWKGFGDISEMGLTEFKEWLDGDATKPVAYEMPAQDLELTGQTEAEIQTDEQAEVEAKKKEAEIEKKAEVDEGVDEFALTGSEREADIAAAAGQEDLLVEPAEEKPDDTKATEVLDAANVRGKDRLDAMSKFRSGEYSLDDLTAAYPADEAVAETSVAEEVEVIAESPSKTLKNTLSEKYPDVDIQLTTGANNGIVVEKIIVKKADRNKGVGSSVMQDIIDFADDAGLVVALTPSKDFGGRIMSLNKFYPRFGFVKNTGKNKDFEFQETMIRQPVTTVAPIDGVGEKADLSKTKFSKKKSEVNYEESEAFKKWAGGADVPVIESWRINDFNFTGEGPFVVKVFHGTTHEFDAFDATQGNFEGQFGAVNYFTSSETDASDNYAGEGPDLTSRIDQRAEQLEYEIQEAIDEKGLEGAVKQFIPDADQFIEDASDIAQVMAKKELSGGAEQTLELYVKTEKPFVVGGERQWLEFVDNEEVENNAIEQVADNNGIEVDEVRASQDDYQDEIDEARWEIEGDTEHPLAVAIQTIADRNNVDASELAGQVYDLGGEATSDSIEALMRESESMMYAEGEEGEIIGFHLIGEVIEELGYDSIILKNAESRFENMNIEYGTAHIHVFDSGKTNIKSVENVGTFDPADPRILFSASSFTTNKSAFIKGITEAQAEEALKIFLKEIGKPSGVKIFIAPTKKSAMTDEAYSKFKKDHVRGFYKSGTEEIGGGRIVLILEDIESVEKAVNVLRHEWVAHHGLNTFNPADKKKIINRIRSSKGEMSLKPAWAHVENNYPNASPDIQAEELLAYMAENKATRLSKLWNDLVLMIQNALKKMGFIGKGKITKAEVIRFVEDLASRVGAGAAQQTYEGEIAYSRERVKGSPEQEAAMADTIATKDHEKTWSARIKGFFDRIRAIDGAELRQGFIDEFNAIAEYEKGEYGEVTDASRSASKAAKRTKNLDSVMAAILMAGPVEYRDGAFQIKKGGKGFNEIFDELSKKGLIPLWEAWAGANRANRLIREGKEQNFTQEQIDVLLMLEHEHLGENGENLFRNALEEYQDFNRQILDMAESVGVIDPEARLLWESNDYVPFYRAMEEIAEGGAEVMGPKGKGGIQGQRSGIKKLIGGEEKVNSIIENMVLNTSHLVDASFKNVAMQRVVELTEDVAMEPVDPAFEPVGIDAGQMINALRKVGVLPDKMTADLVTGDTGVSVGQLTAEERKTYLNLFRRVAPAGNDIVSVMVDGKAKYYRVNDRLLLRSITNMGVKNLDEMMKVMRGAKRLLTKMVTIDPGFMIANFMRDTLSTVVVSHAGLKPGIDAVKGFMDAMDEDPALMAIMAAGGGGGGFYHATPAETQANLHHHLNEMRDKDFKETVLDSPKKLWNAWQKVGAASENANRIAIFKKIKEAGGTTAEAVHQAQDILNFTQTGDFATMKFLIETVPFMNARVQGLDRLYRGAKEDPKAFMVKGMMLAAASMAMLAANWDDDEYDELQEWDKDTYWHFFLGEKDKNGVSPIHLRLPKPFEVGAIFATIPERIARAVAGKDDSKVSAQAAGRMVGDTFAMNPIPQLFKPMAEQYMDKLFFTGSPIVGQALENVAPEAQYSAWTSETMRALAEGMPDNSPEWLRSPKRLESALRGYTGTMGSYVLAAADAITREAGDYPDAPTTSISRYPVLGRFMRGSPTSTKFTNEFYDAVDKANEAYSTIKKYREEGELGKAAELRRESMDLLGARKKLNRYARKISEINNKIKRLQSNRMMTAEKKSSEIDRLTQIKLDLQKKGALIK